LGEYCRNDSCSFEKIEFAKNALTVKVFGSPP